MATWFSFPSRSRPHRNHPGLWADSLRRLRAEEPAGRDDCSVDWFGAATSARVRQFEADQMQAVSEYVLAGIMLTAVPAG